MTRITTALAATLLLPVAANAAGILIIDEDMSSGPGAFDSFALSEDDTDGNLSIDVLGSPAGGNPGDRLEVIHFYDPVDSPDGNPDGYDIQSIHDYQLFSWDPLVDGEILSVSFSIDIETGSNIDLVGFTMAQGSGGSIGGFVVPSLAGGWETISANDLTALDFGSVDFAGTGPITFGFSVSTFAFGSGEDFFDGDQFAANFDNFRVTLTPVPVPGAALLLLSGLAGLAGFRRRAAR